MEDKIPTPYSPLPEELKAIKDNFKDYKDWSNDKFDGFKTNLIADLRVKQKNKCCYCKWNLGYDIKNVDIEHIIPKSKYSQFTFHTKNLAISCPACNTMKSTTDVLHRPVKRYPKNGNNFLIIHAHFDDYNKCIEIHEGSIYEALDNEGKGCDTIKICKLHRMKEVLTKMRTVKTRKSPIRNLVEDLRNATPEDQQEFTDLLNQLTSDLTGS